MTRFSISLFLDFLLFFDLVFALDGKLLEGVNNAVGVNPVLSMSCITIPELGVTGVSCFDVCLTFFEDFGVIKLGSLMSLGSHLESLSLEVLKCSIGVTGGLILEICLSLTGVGVTSV
jgi:hypothetical protein